LMWAPQCSSFSPTNFEDLNGNIVIILQLLALLQVSLSICFKWTPLGHLAFVLVLHYCFRKKITIANEKYEMNYPHFFTNHNL
jgi:hypothetical protein